MKTPRQQLMKPGALRTEARRIAMYMVKEEIKKQGLKVSSFLASDIIRARKELLNHNAAAILKMAKRNLSFK